MNVNEILDKHALHAIIHKKSSSHPKESDESNDIFQLVVGFSPSDGVVIISKNKSAIFVDGRYSLAARQTINQNQFEILDLKRSEIIKWIAKNIPPIHKIAYDPVFYMHSEIEFLKNGLGEYDFAPIDIKEFFDVPAKKRNLNIHYIKNRKAPDEGRLSLICETISKNELNAYLVCEACTIAWLFNVRDFGSKYTPIPELYLLITSNHDKILYVSKAYEINRSGDIKTEEQLHSDLARLHRVGIDKSETPSSICHKDFIHLDNPCLLAKSIKNTEEINDIKKASQKDSIAIINFLHWIYNNDLPEISELDVVKKILYFRTLDSDFIGESFQTIAAADDHAAVVHYSPSEKNSKKIENIL
ncbi:MAG: aminopeptidase P family N-terminal domain-containing protein, partial [Holosporaceae bacterium]|nr:aminopeptidase P family N-terminal domain-containing protein [Holosporaceae bacterium]